MKMKFFGPTENQGVIREVNFDFNADANNENVLENMDFTITPQSSDEDDDYTAGLEDNDFS